MSSLFKKWLLAISAGAVIALLWVTNDVKNDNLILSVNKLTQWDFLETKWLYAWLLLFTIFCPLLYSFEKKIYYFCKWKYFFPGNLLVAFLFIVWDLYFTKIGVWGFNEKYLSGLYLQVLPWEECAFFILIPFSCTFIYEALNFFIKKDILAPFERNISYVLTAFFFIIGIIKWAHIYTATTFILCGFLMLYHLIFVEEKYRSRFYLAYLVSWIPFLFVNGVLTGGFTQEPVVVYNPEEYFGLRIGSIPIDDSAYSFLLLLGNITLYEMAKKRQASEPKAI